jgi:hypothetical protein
MGGSAGVRTEIAYEMGDAALGHKLTGMAVSVPPLRIGDLL